MEVLNVPNLRFGEYSDEWNLNELQKVATLSKGSGISKDQLSENGTPCILYGELYTKYNSEIISEVYSKTELDTSNLVKSKENDVIIPCSGETAIDISTARCVPFNGVLLGGDLNIIRLKNQNGGFFAYQLNGKRKVDIAKVAQGVSVVHLYGEHLKRVTVAYPTYSEQKKIADFLSLLDERIATQNKIIQQLQSLIKGIVVEHYNKSHKSKAKIKDLGRAYSVMNMSKEDLSETGNECIIYGELFTTYDCVATNIVSRTEKAIQSSTISTGNDLLFPASTTVDAQSLIAPTAISQPNIILGGDMFRIVVDKKYNNEYLSYIFNYVYKNYLARYAQGSTIIHLHYNDIKNLDIELPDINTQKELVLLLQNMQDKILIEKKMLSMLETQKAYLLMNLFI